MKGKYFPSKMFFFFFLENKLVSNLFSYVWLVREKYVLVYDWYEKHSLENVFYFRLESKKYLLGK